MVDRLILINDVESNDIGSLTEVLFSIDLDENVFFLRLHLFIEFINEGNEQIGVYLLSLVNEIVCDIILKKFETQGCSIKA